jgi:tRNA pseudouridine38-40 synthase
MRQAAGLIVGDHDFSAFTCKDEDRSPWISMKESSIRNTRPGQVEIVFAANRFLRKMVRLLTGTLVEVGRGRLKPGQVYDILSARNRAGGGPCAPPHGLYLVSVEY